MRTVSTTSIVLVTVPTVRGLDFRVYAADGAAPIPYQLRIECMGEDRPLTDLVPAPARPVVKALVRAVVSWIETVRGVTPDPAAPAPVLEDP